VPHHARWLLSSLLVVLLCVSAPVPASHAQADSPPPEPDTIDAAASQPRSLTCPVLYTHEVGSPALLRRMLLALLGAGYRPTSLAAVDDALNGVADPPRGCSVLTFDDSLYSQYANAMPVLLDLGLPAVFFALPGFADGVHRYMGPTELRALEDAGFEVESHTCNHPNLVLLAHHDLDAFFAELQDCKHMLEDLLDTPVNYIAYPMGAVDATVIDATGRFGFHLGFTTRGGARLSNIAPLSLPRIRYDVAEAPASVLRRIRASGG
jgi:peptidoglycan/xylan/chitin deacetylase (PgdA/CDA1 family)